VNVSKSTVSPPRERPETKRLLKEGSRDPLLGGWRMIIDLAFVIILLLGAGVLWWVFGAKGTK
jgi:hypothetical protein